MKRRAKDAPRRKQGAHQEAQPIIHLDYHELGGSNDGAHCNLKGLVAIETTYGAILTVPVQKKGSSDLYALESVCHWLKVIMPPADRYPQRLRAFHHRLRRQGRLCLQRERRPLADCARDFAETFVAEQRRSRASNPDDGWHPESHEEGHRDRHGAKDLMQNTPRLDGCYVTQAGFTHVSRGMQQMGGLASRSYAYGATSLRL